MAPPMRRTSLDELRLLQLQKLHLQQSSSYIHSSYCIDATFENFSLYTYGECAFTYPSNKWYKSTGIIVMKIMWNVVVVVVVVYFAVLNMWNFSAKKYGDPL